MKVSKTATVLLLAASLAACRSTQQTSYVHKNADLGAIGKVAVLPFDNLSQERSAGDKVQKIFYLELLALDVFEVAEPGQVTKVLRTQTTSDALGPAEYQKIGKDLGVDGVFVGSVVDFAETHAGGTPTPEVTIQLRLIETHSGSTVWSTGQTRSGASVSTRLFGVGGESMTQAARRVVRAELGTLLK
jgi:TolB-like protein